MARRAPDDEIKIYGDKAAEAALRSRLDSVRKVFLTEAQARRYGEALSQLAKRRIGYEIVDEAALEKVSGSRHHEGICLFLSYREPSLEEIFFHASPNAIFLGLEAVDNPHNLGAILRTAAHFGVEAVLVSGMSHRVTGATFRTAQGGAERVPLCVLDDLAEAVIDAKDEGFHVVAFAGEAADSLFGLRRQGKSLLLFGSEGEGLSRELKKLADTRIRIPGTGGVESLNVAQASAAALTEFWRQGHGRHQASSGPRGPRSTGPRSSDGPRSTGRPGPRSSDGPRRSGRAGPRASSGPRGPRSR